MLAMKSFGIFVVSVLFCAATTYSVPTEIVDEGSCNCTIEAGSYANKDLGYFERVSTYNRSWIIVNGERIADFPQTPPSTLWRGINVAILRWQEGRCQVNHSEGFDTWARTDAGTRLEKVLRCALPGDIVVAVVNDEASNHIGWPLRRLLWSMGVIKHRKECGDRFYRSAFAFITRVGSPELGKYIQTYKGMGPVLMKAKLCPTNAPDGGDKMACEGGKVDLFCPAGKTLHITAANYGRKDSELCPAGSLMDRTNCASTRSMEIVRAKCQGKQQCSVNATNSVFGDPCYGVYKYLKINYDCNGGNSSADTPTQPSHQNFDIKVVTLTGGRTSSEGMVTIQGQTNNDTWMLYTNPREWNYGSNKLSRRANKIAKVVCGQLGYGNRDDHVAVRAPYFPMEAFTTRILYASCHGNETSLTDCQTIVPADPYKLDSCYEPLAIKCSKPLPDQYPFGFPAFRRALTDGWTNAAFITHPAEKISHEGYVTKWHYFPINAATVYFQIWRQVPDSYQRNQISHRVYDYGHDIDLVHRSRYRPVYRSRYRPVYIPVQHLYFLVGQTMVNVTEDQLYKKQTVLLREDRRIPFRENDMIGLYLPAKSPIPFSAIKEQCRYQDYKKGLYVHYPQSMQVYKQFYCRRMSPWNPCRMYSYYATVLNTTVSEHVTIPLPTTTPKPTPPSRLVIKLKDGRTQSEGIVQVALPGTENWGYVCGDSWTDLEASVTCKQLGFAGGSPREPSFFGSDDYYWMGKGKMLLQVRCTGNETSLADCKALSQWGSTSYSCRYSGPASVQCIPPAVGKDSDVSNRTIAFGYPAVSRSFTASDYRSGVEILGLDEGFPSSGSNITSFTVYFVPQSGHSRPVNQSMYIQVWRHHGNRWKDDIHRDFMLVGQEQVSAEGPGQKTVQVDPPIEAKAGDLLGLYFPGVNRIPWGRSNKCGTSWRLEKQTDYMTKERVYTFHKKSSCQMYSVFASYHLIDAEIMMSFTFGNHEYSIVNDRRLSSSLDDAKEFCEHNMGINWTLVNVGSEAEINKINYALNTIHTKTIVEYWIGNPVKYLSRKTVEEEPYMRWGHCQPDEKFSCVALSNDHKGAGSYSGMDFHMYTRNCYQPNAFICEYSPGDTPDEGRSTVTAVFNATYAPSVHKKFIGGWDKGTLAGIVIGILLAVAAIVFLALFLLRMRQRKIGNSFMRFSRLSSTS